jgi:diaminohydroxyphosphoribosylaminopyrimidine deaminase/5-amino-6-(5-phosphoribosylamino)uracil reductase
MNSADEKYMRLALKLAKKGISEVEPNPTVGCVIVKNNQIIGKGWHKRFGGPHAEINALQDCKSTGATADGATMYVTLEPCCHQGKTAPCTDAIITAKIAKVVVATIDPSKHANGKGIEQLRNGGINVQVGLCEKEARLLNAPFVKFATTGKCWVILKWAQSINGKLSYPEGNEKRWISGERSRKDMHKLRRRIQGILVGINTVIADDPLLTARPSRDKKATRIVLDSHLRIPLNCRLLATAKKTPVLIITSQEVVQTNPDKQEKIAQKGAELLTVPTTQGRADLVFLLDELSRRGIAQLLVEGGPTVITEFLRQRLADEICVYIAPKIVGGSGSIDISEPMAKLAEAVGLHYVDIKRFGDDVRITGFSKKAINEISIVEG